MTMLIHPIPLDDYHCADGGHDNTELIALAKDTDGAAAYRVTISGKDEALHALVFPKHGVATYPTETWNENEIHQALGLCHGHALDELEGVPEYLLREPVPPRSRPACH